MDARVTLSEQTAEVRDLALKKMQPKAIAAATGLTVPSVVYKLRVLRKAGLVPYVRPPKASPGNGASGGLRVDGILSAQVEQIRVVTCPKCSAKIQVVGA